MSIQPTSSSTRLETASSPPDALGPWRQILVLLVLATLVRVPYLWDTRALDGDGLSYCVIARALATGRYHGIDPFWMSLFSFWQAPFQMFTHHAILAAIMSTLLPSVLIVIPVVFLSRALFDVRVAWLAGVACCLHPMLVEYGCNGMQESSYILLYTLATWGLTWALWRDDLAAAFLAGLAFGGFVGVRNEALAAFLVTLPLLFVGARASKVALGRKAAQAFLMVLGFAIVLGAYIGGSLATTGHACFFQKASNLSKKSADWLDKSASAREFYGAHGKLHGGGPGEKMTLLDKVETLAYRWPLNLRVELYRFSIVIAPCFLFLLPLFRRGWLPPGTRLEQTLPLAFQIAFPLLFYPVVQVEARYFLPALVPLLIFGAAAFLALFDALSDPMRRKGLVGVTAFAFVGLTCAYLTYRAIHVGGSVADDRKMAKWMAVHVPPQDCVLYGVYGAGKVACFLSHRQTYPGLWTDNLAAFQPFARAHGAQWVLLYEQTLRQIDPAVLPALDHGLPGFELAYQMRDFENERIQLYHLIDAAPGASAPASGASAPAPGASAPAPGASAPAPGASSPAPTASP